MLALPRLVRGVDGPIRPLDQMRLDSPRWRPRRPTDDRLVDALDPVMEELALQRLIRFVPLRKDQQSAGVSIKAVNQARAARGSFMAM